MLLRIVKDLGVPLKRAISERVDAAETRCRPLMCKIAILRGLQGAMDDHVASRDLNPLPVPALVDVFPHDGASVADQLLQNTILWMAVPKKRTSHSKKCMRMAHKWLKPIQNYTYCDTCGSPKLLHVLCGTCFKETMRKTAEYRNEMEQRRTASREAMELKPFHELSEASRTTDKDSDTGSV